MSTAHRTNQINNSSAKHTFGFSKSTRFAPMKQYNATASYDVKTQFSSTAVKPPAGFLSGSKRFTRGLCGSVSPNSYAPRDELNNNFSSTRKYTGHTRIGKHNISFMDTEWKNGSTVREKSYGPGPGQYARFSDFGGLEKVDVLAPHGSKISKK